MKQVTRYAMTTGVLVFLSACGQAAAPANTTTPCISGATIPCACPDGTASARVCDAGQFGACGCSDASAGSDTLVDAAPDASPSSDTTTDTPLADAPSAPDVDAVGGTDTLSADTVAAVPCQSDKDCTSAGEVCDPLTKKCVPCLIDADCPESHHCIATTCVGFTTCTNSLGCTTATGPGGQDQPICDAVTSECTTCLTAADCPANNDCTAKTCVPFVVCQNSTQCSQDAVCDTTSNRCVQCLGNSDCPENALCEAGACRPFTPCVSDKACTKLGQLCDMVKGKCAQCLKNADCPDIYHCEADGPAGTGVCVLDVCAQAQGACANNAKVTCNAVGDGFGAPQPCAIKTTCVAPGGKPTCKPWVCTPGVACDGDKVVSCADDGLSIDATEDCAATGGKCVSGTCKPVICAADEVFCDALDVKKCSADGLSAIAIQTCEANQFCGGGLCKPQVCAPGQPTCDGAVSSLCNADGSGLITGGVDCSASQAVCVAGVCKLQVCDPTQTKYCDGNTAMLCDVSGTKATVGQLCDANSFCQAGSCKPQVCSPGLAGCAGNQPSVCNLAGSGFDPVGNACAAGLTCQAGTCQPLLCSPATLFCDGTVLKLCATDGLKASTFKTCGAGYFCGIGPSGDAGCLANVCEPDQPTCNGTTATACKADGSGYSPVGVDCAINSKVCSGGACVNLLCDPATPLFCDGDTVKSCQSAGTQVSTVQSCGGGSFCKNGTCQAQVCAPGSAGCSGNQPATCNAQGSAYVANASDCIGISSGCEAGVCDKGTGTCVLAAKANCCTQGQCCDIANQVYYSSGTNCDDGDPCTTPDKCDANHTCAGTAKNCDDGNACTLDSCTNGVCAHTSASAATTCSTGKACTTGDHCNGSGTCSAGTTKTCGTNATCTEPAGCACNAGYFGDGTTCSVACGAGTVAVDVDGAKFCAPDYPAWGIRPDSPTTAWFVDNGDGTITDTQSKLVWAKADSTTTVTEADAQTYCQALVVGGKNIWRVPTQFELATLIDYKKTSPSVPTVLAATTSATTYWTASPVYGQNGSFWAVKFDLGTGSSTVIDGALRVRCVLNGPSASLPSGRFQVSFPAGTVYDTVTKLTWQQDGSSGVAQTYGNAGVLCSGLTLSGGGWRLPTIVELRSIVELGKAGPAIDGIAFPSTSPTNFWTTSVYAVDSWYNWSVNFANGADKTSTSYVCCSASLRARCVR